MPRQVDHAERRAQIVDAALVLIAEHGLAGLSFREVGRRLGGSTTLVTHYFGSRDELLKAMADLAVEKYRRDLRPIEERVADPLRRLHAVLYEWLLPVVGEGLVNERARINLVAAGLQGDGTQYTLDAWEAALRDVFARLLKPLVPPRKVEHYADVLRLAFNGLALSVVEHPEYWTAERQIAVFKTVVVGLGLRRR